MENQFDVAIIGSGPAGLTAGIYATRGAAKTLILGGEKWGGQLMLTTTVDNYPGFENGIEGPDLMNNMKLQADRFGATFLAKNVESVNFSKNPLELVADGKKYSAKSVIIATGADTVWLGLKGEQELIGRGISSCAPCDAPFFKNKKVAVVGGGDSAMEEALTLTKFATEVTIIHRRDKFRASAIMQERVLKNPKIKVLWNSEVAQIIGDQKLEKLILKDNSELVVDGLFVAIGHTPSSKIFEGQIDLDEKGFIKKVPQEGYQMTTSKPGVFVAGDVHDYHYKQAITAAGFGCMAGLESLRYISG